MQNEKHADESYYVAYLHISINSSIYEVFINFHPKTIFNANKVHLSLLQIHGYYFNCKHTLKWL